MCLFLWLGGVPSCPENWCCCQGRGFRITSLWLSLHSITSVYNIALLNTKGLYVSAYGLYSVPHGSFWCDLCSCSSKLWGACIYGCRTFTGQIVEIWSPFPVTIHSTSWSTKWGDHILNVVTLCFTRILVMVNQDRVLFIIFWLSACVKLTADVFHNLSKHKFVYLLVSSKGSRWAHASVCYLLAWVQLTCALWFTEGDGCSIFGEWQARRWARCGGCLWTSAWNLRACPYWCVGWWLLHLQQLILAPQLLCWWGGMYADI